MIRREKVDALIRAGHEGMLPVSAGTTSSEVVSALLLMAAQGIRAGQACGCTAESLRMAVHSLYLEIQDDAPPS